MRIKSSKGMEKRILESSRYIRDPFAYKFRWNEYFGNNNCIHLELGMGKGDFIVETAENNPDINYIGIEKYLLVIARAAGKLEAADINNVALLVQDIGYLEDIVSENSVERIYLNFLDPWPKKRHEKRRCTNQHFLEKYKNVMRKGGEIHFKTDNKKFYEYTLEKFKESGFDITFITNDLENSEFAGNNVQTEYEKKYTALGKSIKKIIAVKK